MALAAADLLSPLGDVDGAVWFPSLLSGAVSTLLTGYIADAVARTDVVAAQPLWAYYRAATAVADRMASEAASKTIALVNQGSKSTTTLEAQIQYWIDKAAGYLAAFNAATVVDTEDDVDGWNVLTSLRHA